MKYGEIGRRVRRLGRGTGSGAALARGAGAFLAIHVLGLAAGFAVSVALARSMGPEGYGIYVYAFTWLAFLRLLCLLGLDTGAVRFVPALGATGDWPALRGFLRMSRRLVALASVAVAAIGALCLALLQDRLPPALATTFWVACASLPILAALELCAATLRGLLRVVPSQVPGRILLPAVMLLLLFGWRQLGLDLGPAAAMGLQALSAILALLVAGLMLRGAIPQEARRGPAVARRREWLRAAAPFLLSSTLWLAMARTDILLLGTLRGPTEAGLYGPASRLASIIGFGLVAVNAWIGPLASEIHARGDRAELARMGRRAAQLIFAFTLPVVVVVLVWGRLILGVFGPEFQAAYPALAILAGGSLANALMGPVGQLMNMTGRQDAAAKVLLLFALVNVTLNLALIPRYGIEGAALATALSLSGWNVHMAILVRRSLRVRTTIW